MPNDMEGLEALLRHAVLQAIHQVGISGFRATSLFASNAAIIEVKQAA